MISSPPSLDQRKNLKILIVDDNEAIHEDFRKVLAPSLNDESAFDAEHAELFGDDGRRKVRRLAFELVFATQGQQAYELVRDAAIEGKPFAVAFVDVRMPPGMDGLETTAKLWTVDENLQTVICTAHSDKSWEEMAEMLPHPDRLVILKKPFDNIEVQQLAHALTAKWTLHKELERHVEALKLTVSDRTEALTAEMALHQRSQERVRELDELLNKAQDAIIMTDANRRVVYWNKGAERIYGWTEAEIMGTEVADVIGMAGAARDEARKGLIEKGEWAGELNHRTKNGEALLIECRWTILYDSEGKPKAHLGIHTDITERRKLAEQVLRMQRMESIGTLASGVAHDLNNALSPIMLGIELLRLRIADDPLANLLNTMEISAQRGREIVRQILTFASGAEGERAAVSMAKLISEQEKLCRNSFYKMIEVKTSVPDDLWKVTADPTQLHQVLMNLCVNARDAMPDGGCLTISAKNVRFEPGSVHVSSGREQGPYVLLSVSDTGMGIPPEIMERVYDPFFTTKGRENGTGLGLSTVLGIVRHHGGFIDAESEPGEGTTFRVYIPATDAAASNEPAAPASLASQPQSNHECILVVDDEQSIRQMIKSALEVHGYEVLLARSGHDAVALFQQHPNDIAVVITDLMMPVFDGHATIQALQEIRPNVTIIAMSGGQTKAPKAQLQEYGSNVSFLQKPFGSDALLGALSAALTKTA